MRTNETLRASAAGGPAGGCGGRRATGGALLVVMIVAIGAVGAADAGSPVWKGAETFAPIRVGPNPDRCGPFPANVEAHFAGSGIDNKGGPFAVTASGCLDTEGNVLSHLEATDTYLGSGDAVHIAPGDAVLDVDPATCTATSQGPVPFTLAGGTGKYAGATGDGVYELAFTLPTCPGPQQTVHVWFSGQLDLAGD